MTTPPHLPGHLTTYTGPMPNLSYAGLRDDMSRTHDLLHEVRMYLHKDQSPQGQKLFRETDAEFKRISMILIELGMAADRTKLDEMKREE